MGRDLDSNDEEADPASSQIVQHDVEKASLLHPGRVTSGSKSWTIHAAT
jgi:hypothetical protein